MNLKKAKIRIFFSLAVLFTLLLTLVVYPHSAHAQQVGVNDAFPALINDWDEGKNYYAICPIEKYYTKADKEENQRRYGFVKRFVTCAKMFIIPATYDLLREISDYFYGTVSAACLLAIMLWGMTMIMGKNTAPYKDAFTVFMKVGAVSTFTLMLGQSNAFPNGLYPVMIEIVDELASIVSTYVGYSTSMPCAANLAGSDVWGRVDCALETLLGGIMSENTLYAGVLGFFIAAFFSGAFGMFVALFGFITIATLIFSLMRATYITITAYIALALMVLVSPIFITLILFKSTYGYFEKWIKLTIGFMLQPLFLFAYLSMMLAAYDTVLYDGRFSIYRAIVPETEIGTYPNTLPPYPPSATDFQLGKWITDKNLYIEGESTIAGVSADPKKADPIKEADTGYGGTMAASKTTDYKVFEGKDFAGYALDYSKTLEAKNIYSLNIPVKKVNWKLMACKHDANACTPYVPLTGISVADAAIKTFNATIDSAINGYLIQLFLSLFIAVLTMFIFYTLLDLMPFIGSGVTGESFSMPSLGTGSTSMPGSGLLKKAQSGMGNLIGGAK